MNSYMSLPVGTSAGYSWVWTAAFAAPTTKPWQNVRQGIRRSEEEGAQKYLPIDNLPMSRLPRWSKTHPRTYKDTYGCARPITRTDRSLQNICNRKWFVYIMHRARDLSAHSTHHTITQPMVANRWGVVPHKSMWWCVWCPSISRSLEVIEGDQTQHKLADTFSHAITHTQSAYSSYSARSLVSLRPDIRNETTHTNTKTLY